MTTDFYMTRAYGRVINARAKTHAPKDIHALLITHRNGKEFAPDAYCRSNLTGTVIEGLTRADVTCAACIKGMARCDASPTANKWE
jgi:hypothetical protein